MNCCAIIPVYNHGGTVGHVLSVIRHQQLHCILVDDGSEPHCAATLQALAAHNSDVTLVRLTANQGKGGAVMAGMRKAYAMGFSHALQIDADGQHASEDIPALLELARTHPGRLISGQPLYDDSIPKGRLYGRYATHVWVWINTLSLDIRDSMCGFRVYPLAPVIALLNSVQMGRRMDFDIEIMVRLHWRGVGITQLPTKVHYPSDGISHFQGLRDNLLISRMHARLFFAMLTRLPLLLWRKLARASLLK